MSEYASRLSGRVRGHELTMGGIFPAVRLSSSDDDGCSLSPPYLAAPAMRLTSRSRGCFVFRRQGVVYLVARQSVELEVAGSIPVPLMDS